MKKVIFLTALVLCVSATKGFARDLIIRYKDSAQRVELSEVGKTQVLIESLNIEKLEPLSPYSTAFLMSELQNDPWVKWVQEDHPVTERETFPNDPSFVEQWALHNVNDADINAPLAWDLGQGGKDASGHDIVVAVIDGGVDTHHPSLVKNIWVNTHEVAGNGIDDDQNGYVDDIHGWNVFNGSGDIPWSDHGTHVAGIIGARGNDGQQVAGVNWDVKVMAIAGSSFQTSTVIKAYSYVLKQKQLWLSSGGQKGANVVSTNSSFGINRAKCNSSDYPVWNDVYNEMGKNGILSAGATANKDWDIDIEGDVPTSCSSPYLISVTNTNASGKKFKNAGYGLNAIDLGAPGTNILSTIPRGKMAKKTGTSMSTPYVAGAVAFLHNVASHDFNEFYLRTPGEAALRLKRFILENVTPQADLQGRTVSGGRLNLYQAAQRSLRYID